MNLDSNPPSILPRRSWTWIAGVSTAIAALCLVGGLFVLVDPPFFMGALFLAGAGAGAVSSRQAWLSGIIVGLPLALQQLTRHSLQEFGTVSVALAQPDFWRLVLPVSLVATGVAILGALSGSWLLGSRFRPR